MTDIIKPGQAVLYMKVGVHARESLADIIARKTKEIESTGYALWGYGGNTCHPQTMVQPFALAEERKGRPIYLCMEEINSNHFAEPIRADESSVDGRTWTEIPRDINVLGSRYALVIRDLRMQELNLPLSGSRVALGNSMGAVANNYIRGRVDKACLEITDQWEPDAPCIGINLVAEIVKPFAVYVRNKPRL